MTELRLQPDFAPVTYADWHEKAEAGLRGADFDSLISQTEDSLERGPLFDAERRPEDHIALPRQDAPMLEGRPWHICAPVTDPDLAFANQQLLDDLKGGASAVLIDTVAIERRADLKRLLEGVYLDLVPVIFAPKSPATPYALDLNDLHDTPVTLGLDPLNELPDVPEIWRSFTIAAADVHEQGGTDALELACFAATAAEAFRRHGPVVQNQLSALLATGPDAHLNIVKIRAARRLYDTIARAYGIERPAMPIHASTSLRMMQSQDAWTNMLRTMSAGFGAIAGGADYLTVRPFTDAPPERRMGGATPFGHRIARNQQLMMMEESHLGQVRDVAYGSYFHERLTDDLARSAWSKFQSIEAEGGIEPYQQCGDFQADCVTAAKLRSDRAEPILGVTLHPSDDVPEPEVR